MKLQYFVFIVCLFVISIILALQPQTSQTIFLYPMCLAVLPGFLETFFIGNNTALEKYTWWLSALIIFAGYYLGLSVYWKINSISSTALFQGIWCGLVVGIIPALLISESRRFIKKQKLRKRVATANSLTGTHAESVRDSHSSLVIPVD